MRAPDSTVTPPGEGEIPVPPYHGMREMLVLGVVAASFDCEIVLTNNVVPITLRHFTDSALIIAAIIACKRLFGALVQPWASWKSDFVRTRFGRRRPFLLIGLPGVALMLLAMGLLPQFVQGDVARHTASALFMIFAVNCVLQICVDLNWGVLEPLYGDSFRQEQLGRASSLRQLGSKLLTLFMVTYVIGWADHNELWPYLFGFAIFAATSVLTIFGVHEREIEMPPPSNPSGLLSHLEVIMGNSDFLKLACVCTANLALPAALSLFTPLYVTETLGLSMTALGEAQILGVGLSVLLAFPLGWLIDYVGAKWVMAGGFALFAVASAALSFWTHGYHSLFISMTLLGVAQTVALIPMTAMVFQYCAPTERGRVFGVVQFCRAFFSFFISITLGYAVQVSFSYEATPFRSQDITELSVLAERMNKPATPAAHFVYNHLSLGTRTLLPEPAASSGLLRDSIILDLNHIVKGPSIYRPMLFKSVPLSAQTLGLLTENPIDGPRLAVLNRCLITDIFPDLLSRKRNYRLPYEAGIVLSLIAMLVAMSARPGRYFKTLANRPPPATDAVLPQSSPGTAP